MADMQELFGSSDEEANSVQNNDSSDNENEGSVNNDNESGEEHSEQGDDDDEKSSVGSGAENEAAAGSGDERNSNNSGDAESQHGSEGEEASEKEAEGESDEEVHQESDNENNEETKHSDAGSEVQSDQEQANEGSDHSNDGASANEEDEEQQKVGSGAESEADEEQQKVGSGAESEAEEERDQDVEMESEKEESDKEQHSENEEEKAADSDNENEDAEKNAIADDLFGDADDISSGSDNEGRSKETKKSEGEEEEEEDENEESKPKDEEEEEEVARRSGDEEEEHKTLVNEDEEMPEEEPPPEETRIDVEIPKINTDLGKELHFVKLPNFLSVETRPFDPNTYEDEIDDDEVLDEEGRARLKLKVENTIRWRWGFDADQNPVRESNARFIKWSDGSMSLHLGSEIFDVHKQLLQGDHNHLFIRQGTGLQGQAVFRTKLTFRPHSTDSFTHRKITMSVADRSQKTQKIRILPNVGKDPEAHRSEMIKKEEERLRASIRRESKQRRMRERAMSRGLSASYLEGDRYDDDEDDDDGVSLAAIKNKFKKGALRDSRPPIYSSDSEGSEIDDRRARRLEKAKAISDSDDEGSGDEVGPKKKMARIEESEED
ncbi:hypothetical protein CHUAL_010306 [Chamberlinius hualienensis]